MNDKIWQKSDFGNISMTGDNAMRLGRWTQIVLVQILWLVIAIIKYIHTQNMHRNKDEGN